MVKKIHFKISADGEVETNVDGAIGEDCLKMTEDFEEILGETTTRTKKESFYQTTSSDFSENHEGS